DRNRTLELHLYGFESDLYGRRLEVSVIEHIRPIMRFSSAEELQKQMEKDDKEAKAIFSRIKIPAVTLSSRIV
ncbi:MAG: riboflavin kinase, partial [Gemmatimonadota bacterium]|nr:riboflavin kinase [Gemmatimonadota bacterium]